jgi:acyl carrier protein
MMSEFYKGMAEILEIDESQVSGDLVLSSGDAAWDSLAIVSTIALIDDLYAKTLEGKKLTECITIADIEKLISLS